jgi:hypothetical protein
LPVTETVLGAILEQNISQDYGLYRKYKAA